jgi:hypothetical protein
VTTPPPDPKSPFSSPAALPTITLDFVFMRVLCAESVGLLLRKKSLSRRFGSPQCQNFPRCFDA